MCIICSFTLHSSCLVFMCLFEVICFSLLKLHKLHSYLWSWFFIKKNEDFVHYSQCIKLRHLLLTNVSLQCFFWGFLSSGVTFFLFKAFLPKVHFFIFVFSQNFIVFIKIHQIGTQDIWKYNLCKVHTLFTSHKGVTWASVFQFKTEII